MTTNLKNVSLAHHWMTGYRGGEKVLEQFSELFPEAPIHTLVEERSRWVEWMREHKVIPSSLQGFPQAGKRYKSLLPFFPLAVKSMKADKNVRLLLSSDASVIKGMKIPQGAIHVCYCHSPPRYLWDQQAVYLEHTGGLDFWGRLIFKTVTPYVREFDRKAATRVDHFIANSHFVAARIQRYYGRESVVIHPPVALDDFRYETVKDDFYLVVSELTPYKRIDLAVKAFNENGKRLIVVGDGSERKRLEALARDNVTFVGRAPYSELIELYAKAKAFIFPGVEDFGITPLEAMASGTPVIALGEGGVLETVVEDQTGVFFKEITADALVEAVLSFESGAHEITSGKCRARAEAFTPERFREEIWSLLTKWCPWLNETRA